MRLFKRTPKKCDNVSFTYNYLKPERGVQICLGIGNDEKLPGLPEREIAYHHIEVNEIEWLIKQLRDIQEDFNAHHN